MIRHFSVRERRILLPRPIYWRVIKQTSTANGIVAIDRPYATSQVDWLRKIRVGVRGLKVNSSWE